MNKKKKFLSLRVKAVILAFLVGGIITTASDYYVLSRVAKFLYQYKNDRMNELGRAFSLNAEDGVLLEDSAITEKVCYGVMQKHDVLFALVFDQDKNIIAGNYGALPSEYFSHLKQLVYSKEQFITKGERIPVGDPFKGAEVIIEPIYSGRTELTVGGGLLDYDKQEDKEIIGYTAIVYSLKNINDTITQVRMVFIGISGVFLVIMVVSFSLLVNFLIRHLKTLVSATSLFGKGDLSVRVDMHDNDEIGELGQAFNKMASEVEGKNKELRYTLKKLKNASLETIYRLSLAAERRDTYTGEHLFRISHYTEAIAKKMELDKKYIEAILYASLMHDVGKIGIPDRILGKRGKLTDEEWDIMKKHTTIGAEILKDSEAEFIKLARSIALTHHERWDGTGYPVGLKGEEIDLAGRITAVADVFDALTTRRPYKEPFPVEEAFRIIEEGRGSHFDPHIVDVFFSIKDKIIKIKDSTEYDYIES